MHPLFLLVFLCLSAGSALFMMALQVGVDMASWCTTIVSRWNHMRAQNGQNPLGFSSNNFNRRWWSLLISLIISFVLLLGASVGVAVESGDSRTRRLWLACLLAPCGAFLRWYLSRLNTIIASTKGYFAWVPVGTLAANLSASVMEAALSFVVLQVGLAIGCSQYFPMCACSPMLAVSSVVPDS